MSEFVLDEQRGSMWRKSERRDERKALRQTETIDANGFRSLDAFKQEVVRLCNGAESTGSIVAVKAKREETLQNQRTERRDLILIPWARQSKECASVRRSAFVSNVLSIKLIHRERGTDWDNLCPRSSHLSPVAMAEISACIMQCEDKASFMTSWANKSGSVLTSFSPLSISSSLWLSLLHSGRRVPAAELSTAQKLFLSPIYVFASWSILTKKVKTI